MIQRTCFGFAVVLSVVAWARVQAARTDTPADLNADAVLTHIKLLASDEFEGRGTATAGSEKAAHYIAEQFKSCGLLGLGGYHGGFFQNFEVTVGARLGERNSLTPKPAPGRAKLRVGVDFLPTPFSGSGTISGEVVFAGYGISATELNYDDYAGLDLRGKIALILRDSLEGNNPHSAFGHYAALRAKVMSARDRGAKAVLLVAGPLTTTVTEELGPWNLQQGVADAGVPALFITRAVAEQLLSAVGRDLRAVQQLIHEKTQPQSFAVAGVSATVTAEVVKVRKRTANVLGFLAGSDPVRKSEAIVLGAHYDHLGLGEQSGSMAKEPKGQVHRGADDNASGVAGLIELARYFAARRDQLKRSLVFIAFSGEEMGLLGSKHFVESPTWPLAKTVAMLNLDMVGRLKNGRLFVLGGGTSPFWSEALVAANQESTLKFELSAGGSGFGASDHQSFYVKEIPVLHFFTGVHEDYHRPTDTWDRINAEGEAQILRLIARVTMQLQAREERPRFVKLAEPRPVTTGAAGGGGFRVYLGTVPDYAAEVEGVRIEAVREGSPAQQAGLQAGDVLVKFGNRSIRNVEEYSQLLREAEPGKPTELVVVRRQQRVTLTIVPLAR